MAATSARRTSLQTVLLVLAIVLVTLAGICTDSSFADANIRVSSTNNSRLASRQRTPKQSKIRSTTAPKSPSTRRPSDKVYTYTWLSIFYHYYNPPPAIQLCDNAGFTKQQRRVCKQNAEFATAFIHAARSAIQQCQMQFRHNRWNCNVIDTHTVFGNLLRHGTRETAFVYAIASASLTTVITKACSSGDMKSCYCDRTSHTGENPNNGGNPPPPSKPGELTNAQATYVQQGCSDNIHYGMAISRSFVDSRERGRVAQEYPARSLMNLHNNEAGRLLVESSMRMECKCIGISGSCTTKTCARVLPKFDEIAPFLKGKYDNSVKVLERRSPAGKRQLVAHDGRGPSLTQSLVHLHDSFDFCDYNYRMGSQGTRGRLCNATSNGEDHCDRLCCGRDYVTQSYIKTVDCHCVFKFCCKIECQKCEAQITENRCK